MITLTATTKGKLWIGGVLSLSVVMLGLACVSGCVRPQYDSAMGSALILTADSMNAGALDLANDNLALRDKLMESKFFRVQQAAKEVNAAATQLAANPQTTPAQAAALVAQSAGVQQGILNLQRDTAIEQSERAVIAEVIRKMQVATGVARSLGMRSIAIAKSENELLGQFGISSGK